MREKMSLWSKLKVYSLKMLLLRNSNSLWLKGKVRSLTEHFKPNVLAYSNLSTSYRAFVADLDSVQIPNTIFEVLEDGGQGI